MKKVLCLVATLAAAALSCMVSVSPSYATPTTAYVAGGGSDANACTVAAPCRSIGHALSAAGAGSTINCLDVGPYTEAVASGFSYTVDCKGVVYTGAGTCAFSVASANPNPVITFRNITFEGATTTGCAVQIGGGSVIFEHCTFQNFTASPGNAVQFEPNAVGAGAYLIVRDSLFTNNGTGSGGGGIIIQPSAAVKAGAVIERTEVSNNTYGIYASGYNGGTVLVNVRYSKIANNTADGINIANYTQGSVSSLVLEHSASVGNGGNGIYSQGANAYVSLSDSTVDWNAKGLSTGLGGTILSYRNNLIAGNSNPGVTPVSVGQQ
jgi:hypothetical protein